MRRKIRSERPANCRFDEHIAKRAVRFFRKELRHTKGRFAGRPFDLTAEQEQDLMEIFGRVDEDGNRVIRQVYKEIPKKNGKQLALDTPIPTPSGWSTMGEIHVGDLVFDETGKAVTVSGISQINERDRAFQFVFGDGSSIVAGESHLWLARCHCQHKTRIYATGEMARIQREKERGEFSIAIANPIQCPDQDGLPIHPYVYGFWIGNGHSTKPELTICRQDVDVITEKVLESYSIASAWQQEGFSDSIRVPALASILVGHFTEKRIAQPYLRSSVDQRWELLRGLMDSDGCVASGGSGQAIYSSSVPEIAYSVAELLRSLGIKCSIDRIESDRYGKPNLPNYRVLFTAFDDQPVSCLPRKLANRKKRTGITRSNFHYIQEIIEVDKRPMRCIKVDSPSHLYLAGSSMVPTHNSEEAAGIANKLLFADSEFGAEIYGAAADITQASIVFGVAASMVRHNPFLLRMSRIWDSTKRIVVPGTESYYRAVTSKVAGKHGFNSHGVIFDEVHAQQNLDLWDVLTFGAGAARSQPLVYAITTAGIPGQSPVAEMLHDEADQILRGIIPCPDHLYVVMYGSQEGDDWTKEEVWRACNPFLNAKSKDGKPLMRIEDIRKEYDDARRRPEQQNTFRRLRLNEWVAQDVRAISMEDWDACSQSADQDELKKLQWTGGLDLSTRQDITALVLSTRDAAGRYHLMPYFWLPRENLKDRPNQAFEKYRTWAGKGLITLTDGNVVDYASVRRRLNSLRKSGLRIGEIGFDPWNAEHLAQDLREDGFQVVEVRQGFRTLSEPTKEFLDSIIEHTLCHDGHPILRWMADCLAIRQDESANIRPVKPDRMKSVKRIDGIVAAIMAISRLIVNPPKTSIYETRGLLTLN